MISISVDTASVLRSSVLYMTLRSDSFLVRFRSSFVVLRPACFRPAASRPNAVGLPGGHVRALKDVLVILKKGDKKGVFLQPVPSDFRGLKGFYSDVIRSPMDLGTVSKNIDAKYRYRLLDCRVAARRDDSVFAWVKGLLEKETEALFVTVFRCVPL